MHNSRHFSQLQRLLQIDSRGIENKRLVATTFNIDSASILSRGKSEPLAPRTVDVYRTYEAAQPPPDAQEVPRNRKIKEVARVILAAVSLAGPRARSPWSRATPSLRLSYFRSKTDVRRREDPREIHARVKTRRGYLERYGMEGREKERERGTRGSKRNGVGTPRPERERTNDTHAGGTTHVGPVICWTSHGHVVFHGHGVHSIVHFFGAVPRRVVPQPARATLWSERIACDSNRHRHATSRRRQPPSKHR